MEQHDEYAGTPAEFAALFFGGMLVGVLPPQFQVESVQHIPLLKSGWGLLSALVMAMAAATGFFFGLKSDWHVATRRKLIAGLLGFYSGILVGAVLSTLTETHSAGLFGWVGGIGLIGVGFGVWTSQSWHR